MTDQPTADPIGETTPETARALLWRHGLPEDVIDGALALHAGELAAVQRAAISKTDDPVFYEGEAGWLINLITPGDDEPSSAVPVSSPPPDQTALRARIAQALARTKLRPPYLHCLAMADAVLAELPEFAEAHRLALSEALGLGTGAPWDAIHDRATELGLPPLAEDPVAQRLGLVPEPADRAAVLLDAADAVFALDYDVMVGEVGDENFGSMREAWDVGTIHATELLRRLAAEAPQPDTVGPSARAGLRDENADALETADYRPDMRRGDLADAIMPVLYRAWPWLRAEAEDKHTAEAPQPEDDAQTCVHCGKAILRISGTLATWWVHDPGGHTICHPQQAATSPRATPQPAAEEPPAAADTSKEA